MIKTKNQQEKAHTEWYQTSKEEKLRPDLIQVVIVKETAIPLILRTRKKDCLLCIRSPDKKQIGGHSDNRIISGLAELHHHTNKPREKGMGYQSNEMKQLPATHTTKGYPTQSHLSPHEHLNSLLRSTAKISFISHFPPTLSILLEYRTSPVCQLRTHLEKIPSSTEKNPPSHTQRISMVEKTPQRTSSLSKGSLPKEAGCQTRSPSQRNPPNPLPPELHLFPPGRVASSRGYSGEDGRARAGQELLYSHGICGVAMPPKFLTGSL